MENYCVTGECTNNDTNVHMYMYIQHRDFIKSSVNKVFCFHVYMVCLRQVLVSLYKPVHCKQINVIPVPYITIYDEEMQWQS